MLKQIVLGASLAGGLIGSSWAMEDPAIQRGRTFARANCARCHSIDRVTDSPLAIAPPFRTLHTRYPVETLAEALAEGISTGHPTMPEFRLDADQVGDFIAFLKTFDKSR